MSEDDLHALAGAYVMDALDDDEREAFERYMAASPTTAAEVASLREAVAMLGSAVAETPPEGLRQAVMREVDTTRQQRPIVTPIEQAPSRRPAASRAPSWVSRLSIGAAAVAIVVAVAMGVVLANLGQRLEQLEGTNTELATLLVSADAVRHEAGLPDGGRIAALISDQHDSAVAVAEGLPALDEAQMYALWGLVDGSAVPIGELVNGAPLAAHADGLHGLGLTVEPRGPLTQPTGAVQVTLGA